MARALRIMMTVVLVGSVMMAANAAGGEDAKGPTGGAQPMSAGCAKIVAVLEEGGGGLSADEVAKKTSTDVETVRDCTDRWRQGMKESGKP
jgi:hypothetical protein